MNLYQRLQKFDFNVLGRGTRWDFAEFLSWLNLQVSA
jgi:hypothetical protein